MLLKEYVSNQLSRKQALSAPKSSELMPLNVKLENADWGGELVIESYRLDLYHLDICRFSGIGALKRRGSLIVGEHGQSDC